MKPYYYIYRVGGSHPKTKHFTVEFAISESNRLAAQHPGETFEILICVATTRCTTPATFWMDGVNPEDLTDHIRDEAKDREVEDAEPEQFRGIE